MQHEQGGQMFKTMRSGLPEDIYSCQVYPIGSSSGTIRIMQLPSRSTPSGAKMELVVQGYLPPLLTINPLISSCLSAVQHAGLNGPECLLPVPRWWVVAPAWNTSCPPTPLDLGLVEVFPVPTLMVDQGAGPMTKVSAARRRRCWLPKGWFKHTGNG